MFKNKRYKDIFSQYIYKGEATPVTIGTLATVAFCFVVLVVATFSQLNICLPWDETNPVAYTPVIPAMIFIIYLLGRNFSIFLFIIYLSVGLFALPIFLFGGGMSNFQNYIFGYFTGFLSAIIVTGSVLYKCQNLKFRLFAAFLGVSAIHVTGLIYCLILALFKIVDFSIILPVFQALTTSRFLYDLFFSLVVIAFAPYIKNIFWICMKPKMDKKKPRPPLEGQKMYTE